jgi:hypothetical protein
MGTTERRSAVSLRLNLEQLRKQAKERLGVRRAFGEEIKLSDVQYQLALEHGFPSWAKLVAHVRRVHADETVSEPGASARAAVLAFLAKPPDVR